MKSRAQNLEIDSIKEEISRLFTSGNPALEAVARSMHVSPRTLQRRLTEEGFTFKRLVSEVRFLSARRLIVENYKLSEIAMRLGYADASSFTRAFERWTGMSPRRYRSQFGRTNGAPHDKSKY